VALKDNLVTHFEFEDTPATPAERAHAAQCIMLRLRITNLQDEVIELKRLLKESKDDKNTDLYWEGN